MDFVSDSDLAILWAWRIGIISLLLSLIITVYAFFLRVLYVNRKRRGASFLLEWEGLIAESLDQLPQSLPLIKKRDAVSFLMLWNHLQESLRSESKEKLNRLAREIDIDVIAMDFLERGSLDERLLAVNTLGWLRHDTNWEKLVVIANDADPIYSLAAAKALMRITPEKAVRVLMPLIARRRDWATSTVGSILREAGADLISEPLAKTISVAPADQIPRLISFFEIAHAEVAIPAIKRILKTSSDLETITACLRLFQDVDDLYTVRNLLKDDRWQVRLQAAVCLGRIGIEEDEERLLQAAADPEWWVRYRSAQALANLPSITFEKLNQFAEGHPNNLVRNIIKQVVAEKQVAEI